MGMNMVLLHLAVWLTILEKTAILTLQTFNIDRTNVPSVKVISEEETIFGLTLDKSIIKSKYLYFQVVSEDLTEVRIGKPKDLVVACSGYGNLTCVSDLSKTIGLINNPEGFRISVTLKRAQTPQNASQTTLAVVVNDFVSLTPGVHQRVFFHEIDSIQAQILLDPIENTFKSRFQVKAHTTKPFSELEVYANFEKKEFPLSNKYDFKLLHLDSHRMAKMITDAFFCDPKKNTKPCTYNLLLDGRDISSATITIRPLGHIEIIDTELSYVIHNLSSLTT